MICVYNGCQVWAGFDAARWCGVRDSAHEKLYELLTDPIPEVRLPDTRKYLKDVSGEMQKFDFLPTGEVV